MKSNIISEYEMIQRTAFWGEYIKRIAAYVDSLKTTAVAKKDVCIDFVQGEYAGIYKVIHIPDEIVRAEDAKQKSATSQDNLGKGPASATK